jgi:hypothetical protein
MDQKEYEFNEEENATILDLSKKMKFVGIIGIALGISEVFHSFFGERSEIINGIVAIVLGVWTINASRYFKNIVDTSGNDIRNLMDALREMKKLYSLQFWMEIMALLGVVFLIIFIVFGNSGLN